MKLAVILCCCAISGLALACLTAPGDDDKKLWLMFFMKGEGKATVENPMEGHLGNMKKQADLGRLLAAGPMKDPSGQRRGITVVLARDEADVKSLFKDDPFVQAGAMTVAASPWKVDKAKFDPKVDPSALAEYRLVFVGRGKGMQPETEQMQKEHRAILDQLTKKFSPGVWGDVEGMNKVRHVMILSTADSDTIRAALSKDPLVAKAILEIEIVPLFMNKGIIKG